MPSSSGVRKGGGSSSAKKAPTLSDHIKLIRAALDDHYTVHYPSDRRYCREGQLVLKQVTSKVWEQLDRKLHDEKNKTFKGFKKRLNVPSTFEIDADYAAMAQTVRVKFWSCFDHGEKVPKWGRSKGPEDE